MDNYQYKKHFIGKFGNLAIHNAIWDLEQLKEAIHQTSNIDILNELGETALYLAVSYNLFPSVKILIENGANPNIKSKLENLTPLEFANRGYTPTYSMVSGSYNNTPIGTMFMSFDQNMIDNDYAKVIKLLNKYQKQ